MVSGNLVSTSPFTAALAGVTTAFCGPLAFIGIAVPHLARMIFKTYRHRMLLPATALLGAFVLLFCQWLSTLPAQDKMTPINVLTSLLGAPIVVWLVLRHQGR